MSNLLPTLGVFPLTPTHEILDGEPVDATQFGCNPSGSLHDYTEHSTEVLAEKALSQYRIYQAINTLIEAKLG